jgi:hypothetical protein
MYTEDLKSVEPATLIGPPILDSSDTDMCGIYAQDEPLNDNPVVPYITSVTNKADPISIFRETENEPAIALF